MTGVLAPQCLPHLAVGITGHRYANTALQANRDAVAAELTRLFDHIDAILAGLGQSVAPTRMFSLLVDGVDQLAADRADERGWELVAPLPFGQALNLAINAQPSTLADAEALCAGNPASDPDVAARAAAISTMTARAKLFELADRDAGIRPLLLAALDAPGDMAKLREFESRASQQVALANRVMIERIDLLVAVWDRKTRNLVGGTGHTVANALQMGTPVLVIDPARPEIWAIHTRPEELGHPATASDEKLHQIVLGAIGGRAEDNQPEWGAAFHGERWHAASSRIWTGYRRIEAVFGGEGRPWRRLVAAYEAPGAIATGSAADLLASARNLPHADEALAGAIATTILPQFAWADGISSWLSDAYRSGMIYNFLLAAMAVIIGATYLPTGLEAHKWVFAGTELALLLLIVFLTAMGSRRRWHGRWFETRRVAEYLRHGPILLLLGVFRPTGRWPQGASRTWPEAFARHCLRAPGLPQLALDRAYLRACLQTVLAPHVIAQRDYHHAKSLRLHRVHHRLDKLAEGLFVCAILSVSLYLLLKLGSVANLVPHAWPESLSKLLTYTAITFPTLGASIAGIRYFGDFERFAVISQVTERKLEEVAQRITLLLDGPEEAISYASVTDLAHAIDEIVIDEIENWQAVFSGKHIALPA